MSSSTLRTRICGTPRPMGQAVMFGVSFTDIHHRSAVGGCVVRAQKTSFSLGNLRTAAHARSNFEVCSFFVDGYVPLLPIYVVIHDNEQGGFHFSCMLPAAHGSATAL